MCLVNTYLHENIYSILYIIINQNEFINYTCAPSIFTSTSAAGTAEGSSAGGGATAAGSPVGAGGGGLFTCFKSF